VRPPAQPPDHLGADQLDEGPGRRRRAQVEHGRRAVDVVDGAERLAPVPDGVADRQPGVPQRVDDPADDPLEHLDVEPVVEQQQVDVGGGAQLAAP
jgi:hypothetical protein